MEARNELFLAFHLILLTNLFPISFGKLLFLIPYFIFVYSFLIETKYILIGWFLWLLIIVLRRFPEYFYVKNTYLHYINYLFNLNEWIGIGLEGLYGGKMADFIRSIVFGYRGETYGDFLDLGVVHLISVSGFHVSILLGILRRFINSKRIIFSIIFIYWYSIGFSIPCLRPILLLFIRRDNPYGRWAISVIFASLFNVYILSRISFFLSFIFPLLFTINGQIFRTRFIVSIINFWSAFLYAFMVLCPITHRFHPLAPINATIFLAIVPTLFIYFFFTWPFEFLSPFGNWIREIFTDFHSALNLNKSYVEVKFWSIDLTLTILFVITLIFLLWEVWNAKFLLFRGLGSTGSEGQTLQKRTSESSDC